jgi:hypothetical protein
MTPRAAALTHALGGVLLWGAGAGVAAQVPRLSDGSGSAERPAPVVARPEGAPLEERPGQSLRDSEPQSLVGPAFDEDGAMSVRSRRVASYTLSARLDAALHRIDGHGTLVWENASSRPATELFFHLYLNAFKNNRTVFLRSPFGAGRSGRGASKWGYLDVKRLAVRELGDADLWPHGKTASPDDADDETDVRVPLARAIAPGERVTLDLEWTSQLPEIVERTGYKRDFHMVGQWFPKIARREPDGTWVHFPFHAQSEFYSDFGSYDVALDVPAEMIVGATGLCTSEIVGAGRKVLRYRIDDVHDFAWTAWPAFLERAELMDGVNVRLLYPPGNEGNATATLAAIRHGLHHFGAAFGRYPYPVLTVVHPPVWAPAATGMEYPTLITTGFPWYTSLVSTFVERVTLHELGHQWFYGLVATDEHSWPFLDEGLTTHAEASAMKALLGTGDGFRAPGLTIDGDAYLRALAVDAGHDGVVARPAADFASFREIGALVYARTGTILETLGRVYGEPGLRRALGRYARRYRFDHPNPKHLVAVVREVMGDEPAELLRAALFEGGTVDFVAKDLQALPARPAAGIFDKASGRETTDPPEASGAPSRWVGRVLVYRHGTLRIPVDIELRFGNGTRERRTWSGRGGWQAIDCEGTSPLVSAVIDPDAKILLDEDLTNNSLTRTTGSTARLLERGLYVAELGLATLGP